MPVLAFLFIFIVCYALFSKTKVLGGDDTTNVFVSFLIALIFMLNPPATKFTLATVPWIGVLLFVLLFVLVILVFVRGKIDDLVKSQVVAFILVAAVLLVFLGAAINVFGPLVYMLSTGSIETAATGTGLDLLMNPTIIGAIILIAIAGVTYYLLVGGEK